MSEVAIFTQEGGRVVRRHFQPETLSDAQKKDAVMVDKKDIPSRPKDFSRFEKPLLYLVDGKLEWRMEFRGYEESVPRYKLKIALKNAGLLEKVQDEIDQMDEEVKIAWNDSSEIARNSGTVKLLAEKLELKEEEVNNLFIEADKVDL